MFCCHLTVEKALKAVLQHQTGHLPPRLHDLRALLGRTRLAPPAGLKGSIDRLAGLSMAARYPAPLSSARLGLRRATVERTIRHGAKVVHWCCEQCH
jgi:HEPN domain-containing protein